MRNKTEQLSWDRLSAIVDYNVDTGIFTNKVGTRNRRLGATAGGLRPDGYIAISIDSVRYLAHRLAWFYVHKTWPKDLIDHIDGNKSNNCISNLREATHSTNAQNTGVVSDNSTGFRGVTYDTSRGKYLARICINGIEKNLGRFTTAEEASIVYTAAAKQHFGEFFNENTIHSRLASETKSKERPSALGT